MLWPACSSVLALGRSALAHQPPPDSCSPPFIPAFSKCGFCHPDLISVVETAAEKLLQEPVGESSKVRRAARAGECCCVAAGGAERRTAARPRRMQCGHTPRTRTDTLDRSLPPKPPTPPHPTSPAHLPLQAIADILDAYSRVGCSSPESVDELVEKIPGHADAFDPEHLAKVTVATIRLG